MSDTQENSRSLRTQISSALNRARQIGRRYVNWTNTSPEKRILNGLTWLAFVTAINQSEGYLNRPMALEEMTVYEGVLEKFSRKSTRFGACGARLVVKTLAGPTLEFRSHTGTDFNVFVGKPVKIWARERNYNFWCFSVTPYLHQIVAEGNFVDEYTDEDYQRNVKHYKEGLRWWVGIPASIGFLGLFGLWRTDRRDRRKVGRSIEKPGERL